MCGHGRAPRTGRRSRAVAPRRTTAPSAPRVTTGPSPGPGRRFPPRPRHAPAAVNPNQGGSRRGDPMSLPFNRRFLVVACTLGLAGGSGAVDPVPSVTPVTTAGRRDAVVDVVE